MPAVLRRINRIFRRNSRDQSTQNLNNNQNNTNANPVNNRNLHRHPNTQQPISSTHVNADQDVDQVMYGPSPIKLRSTGYQRQSDGSVTLSVTLDKDQVECCVCLSSMTATIYRCRGSGPSASSASSSTSTEQRNIVCHNVCSSCHWQMRRMKSGNGHTKEMQCPICKVKGKFVRNRALERQLLELSQECTHCKYGCTERFFPWDDTRKLHEKHLCVYQPIDCPFCYQAISGGRVNFVEHLVKSVQNIESQHVIEDVEHEIMEESQSMIDEEMNNNDSENDEDSENEIVNDVDFEENDDSANYDENQDNEDEDEDQDQEEEQKQAINNGNDDDDDDMLLDEMNKTNDKIQYVVPCLVPWYESKACLDLNQMERNLISRNRNEFIVNYNLGIIICFIAPSSDCECWKVYALSISPRHGIGGNSRVYIQYFNEEKMSKFTEKEQSLGLITQCQSRPVGNTLILNLGRLHPTTLRSLFGTYPSANPFVNNNNIDRDEVCNQNNKKIFAPMNEMKDDDDVDDNTKGNGADVNNNNNMELDESEIEDLEEYRPMAFLGESPCTQLQCGFIYGGHHLYGNNSVIDQLSVRVFTLEQSLKVGAVIDARDFTGKWYQAEVIAVKDAEGNEYTNLDYDNDDYLEIRKAKIHYLGYSQNYDEWLFVDTDSHRIAQRGIFTIGPDLRAIRRNTTNLAASNNGNMPHAMSRHPVHRHHQAIRNRNGNNSNPNNNNNNNNNAIDVDQSN